MPTCRQLALLIVIGSWIASIGIGCAPNRSACPAQTPAPTPPAVRADENEPRHVYRFDFVLTVTDASGAPIATAFTLNLAERQTGELMVGKNIPLVMAAPPSAPTPSGPGAPPPPPHVPTGMRQDVGNKVSAVFRTTGDDVLLDVSTEMTSSDPPVIQKTIMRGSALATAGKTVVVCSLDEDHKRFQLSVTPTKLR